ncbi:MAG TPA: hypothetical protein VGN51_03790 [Acidimicrobiia bacterium]
MNEHLLDTELLRLAEGDAEAEVAELWNQHLAECALCAERFRVYPAGGQRPRTTPSFDMEVLPDELRRLIVSSTSKGEAPQPGQVWRLVGSDEAVMALILRVRETGLIVAPVTLDVELADDATPVVTAEASPIGIALAVWGSLTSEVTLDSADRYLFDLPLVDAVRQARSGTDPSLPGVTRGVPIVSVIDTRVEYRQHLLEVLESLSPHSYDDEDDDEDDDEIDGGKFDDTYERVEALPAWARQRPDLARLVQDLELELQIRRPSGCVLRYLPKLDQVLVAEKTLFGVAVVSEMDVVLPIFVSETPSFVGIPLETPAQLLKKDADATAVVIAVGSGLTAEAIAVQPHEANDAIEAPSGEIAPPRWPSPLGLPDCVAGFLEQSIWTWEPVSDSALHVATLNMVDVVARATQEALAETAARSTGFKITEKKDGYSSIGATDAPAITSLVTASEANGHGGASRLIDEYIGAPT